MNPSKKKTLNELYQKVEKISGFTTHPDCRQSMLFQNDGDFRTGSGLYNLRPAILTVAASPELFNRNTVETEQRYGLESHLNARPSLWLPALLLGHDGKNSDLPAFSIKERIEGERFLNRYPASNSRQKGIVADLYWNTADNFRVISGAFSDLSLTMARNQEYLVSLFFGRLAHWMDLGQAAFDREKDQAAAEVLRGDLDLIDLTISRLKHGKAVEELAYKYGLEVELFFRHFGHTDMIYQKNTGRFFLPLPPQRAFIVCPQFYGAAYFIWNVLMYSYGRSPDWGVAETERWRKVFEMHAPPERKSRFRPGFYLNLLERMTGALLADLSEKRSPFNRHGAYGSKKKVAREIKNARKIFRAVLEKCLQEIAA